MTDHTLSIKEDFGDQPFLVSASTLQKITVIVAARKQGQLGISLGFSDGTAMENVNIERLSIEENPKSRRLTRVSMSFKTEYYEDSVRLTFNHSDYNPISLAVESKDPDWVTLLAAELRDTIRSEALVEGYEKSLLIFKSVTVLLLISFAVFCTVPVFSTTSQALPSISEVLKSSDPNVKLDYIITRQYAAPSVPASKVWTAVVGWPLLVLGLPTTLIGKPSLFKFFFPANEFLIGAGQERVNRRRALRTNIFWAVLIGLSINVIAGLILLFVHQ